MSPTLGSVRRQRHRQQPLHKVYINHRTSVIRAVFFRHRRIVQQRVMEMHDAWMTRKAEDIQGYVDRNELKNFLALAKTNYGLPTKRTALLPGS
nr:unnamed protein product [Spirometra erinaceieuropaei]